MSEKQNLTPMLKQYLGFKKQHPDKLILFRMGDFYETFFDDAKTAARVLNITLTTRDRRSDNPIPLAGIPHHALEKYLDRLIGQGHKVVICEQLEDPRQAKGIVKRGIVEVITPGAVLDQQLIGRPDNNFLAAISYREKAVKIGMAAIDISTGDFHYTELKPEQLADELARLHPAEIVVNSQTCNELIHEHIPDIKTSITLHETWKADPREAAKLLMEHLGTTTLEGFSARGHPAAVSAAGLALSYLQSLKQENLDHVDSIRWYSLDEYMELDGITMRNLELIRSLRDNQRDGSLISVIDHTRTPMGSRLLQEWLLHPLLNREQIEDRLNAVEEFKNLIHLTEDLRAILSQIGDLSRVLGKLGARRANPRDLLALAEYLDHAEDLRNLLDEFHAPLTQSLRDQIGDYRELVDLIQNGLVEEPPTSITEGNIFREDYNEELIRLRAGSREGKGWIARLETKERERTGIPKLKVGYNKVFGYYLEVSRAQRDKVPDDYIRKQTLVNSERFISDELKKYETEVLSAEERMKSLEYELFVQLRTRLSEQVSFIKQFVHVLAGIDVLSGFAWHAFVNDYRRPDFNNQGLLFLKDCRHPVVEKLLDSERYIPNDVEMDDTGCRIALITGPNMAGKSTYLRQIGLNVILAQTGSFIPAEKASLPIFDRVFTRVGASDNLARGQSTFLVEMIETAHILSSATPQSLILLDEIGRGTSTFDGLSLAWSIVEYIHNRPSLRSKTLFATHYHELTELENVLDGVVNFNIAVREYKQQLIFVRRIERGGADQSYGIQVARLAGVPKQVINRARQILRNLEEHELSPQGLTARLRKQLAGQSPQRDIFEVIAEKAEEGEEVVDRIRALDMDNMTPLEALQILTEIHKKLQ